MTKKELEKILGATQTQQIEQVTEPLKEKKSTIGTAWDFLSKQLMKPIGVVAAETEALGRLIGSGKTYNPLTTATDIITGKREYSFSKLWDEYGEAAGVPKSVGTVIGLATDIAADPLNFVGIGTLTKTGKLAQKVSSLREAGETIKKGSKLFNEIKKSGYTAEQLSLAGSRIEQIQKKQRALVSVMGKSVIGGEKIYEKAGQLSSKIAETPQFANITKQLGNIFSTKSGIKELDDMIEAFDNLSGYRKEKVIEKATEIQRSINKLKPDEIRLIPELIENPQIRNDILNKEVVKLSDDISSMFKTMKTEEKKLGVLGTELTDYFPHIKNKDELGNTLNSFFNSKKYSDMLKSSKGRKIGGTLNEINETFGKDFFISNPALAYGIRGTASAKAITAREFLEDVGKKFFVNAEDAPLTYIDSTNPLFKGLKASPEVVQTIDKYITGIKPNELKPMLKAFDNVQNWWKSQALISPMYHIRNSIGNMWNNFLGGVYNPVTYKKAGTIQLGKNLDEIVSITRNGQKLTGRKLLELAEKNGVINRGQFTGDIAEAIQDQMYNAIDAAKTLDGYNPLSQRNIIFKGNKAIGAAVENNAKIAHFIQKLEDGYSAKTAAQSVKKYLFDYNDLTEVEKRVFKRIAPFYTWTRKNIPLQIENLAVNPEKWSLIPKVIQSIESGSKDPETEKYMSEYLKDNIPVKIGQDENGNYQYFMLGQWLPSAQAIDFLSQPLDNMLAMATPLIKAPLEYWSNKSTFFKNTLGEPSEIEYYDRQPTTFLNVEMRKKTANLLRNIRVLNDINKLIQTPSKDEPENAAAIKVLNFFFGKAGTYDVSQSKKYYDLDTETRIQELEQSIKRAKKDGKVDYAKKLSEELKQFKKERYSKE